MPPNGWKHFENMWNSVSPTHSAGKIIQKRLYVRQHEWNRNVAAPGARGGCDTSLMFCLRGKLTALLYILKSGPCGDKTCASWWSWIFFVFPGPKQTARPRIQFLGASDDDDDEEEERSESLKVATENFLPPRIVPQIRFTASKGDQKKTTPKVRWKGKLQFSVRVLILTLT